MLAVAVLASSLGGCAGLGLPFADVDRTTTASIRGAGPVLASATAVDQVEPSDWQSVQKAIAAAPSAASTAIPWTNPLTGTTGTVALAAGADTRGACRTFATTVNDVRGVRRYRGDACRGLTGTVTLRNVAADDVIIS